PGGPLALQFMLAVEHAGWRLHETLVWVKDSMVLGHSDYHWRHEPLLFGYLPGEGRGGPRRRPTPPQPNYAPPPPRRKAPRGPHPQPSHRPPFFSGRRGAPPPPSL